jgi:predicted Zn-dependent protease
MKPLSFSTHLPSLDCRKRALERVRVLLIALALVSPLSNAEPEGIAHVEPSPSSSTPLSTGRLPRIGDGAEMGFGQERRIGDSIAKEIYKDPDYVEDPILLEYVQSIWLKLMEAAKFRGDISSEMQERFAWEVLLIKDPSINAFALPGGYMGVHLGLIGIVSNSDELASVLGHELSHITQRHISRMFTQQAQQAPLLMGAMLLGILAAGRNPNAGGALMVGGQAAVTQSQLNFSRDMEREADRLGYGVMTQAGYLGAGFVTMFQKLQNASRLNDNGSYPYLRSHPLTTERIADMQSRELDIGKDASPLADLANQCLHSMMAARSRVLVQHDVQGLQTLLDIASQPNLNPKRDVPQQMGVLYAGALAASKTRRPQMAQLFLTRLNDLLSPLNNAQLTGQWAQLKAEIALAQNAPLSSIALLQSLPQSRATSMALAQSRLLTELPAQIALAKEDMTLWIQRHPTDIQAWELLSQAQAQSADPIGSIRSMAESYALKFDYPAAIDRLRAAQAKIKQLQTSGALSRAQEMQASIVDARLRALLELRKAETLEK